jgi:ATP-dependent DNA helicase Q1
MALTATCPWNVMKDVMRILGMKEPQFIGGSLVFSAPLYRKYHSLDPTYM